MDQTQTSRYVSRFEALLYIPAFRQKNFHYVHTGPSTKGPLLRNYNSTPGVHNSSLKHKISSQEVSTKPNTKQRKIHLVITKITNSLLVISKDHKQFSHKNKILKIGLELTGSSM